MNSEKPTFWLVMLAIALAMAIFVAPALAGASGRISQSRPAAPAPQQPLQCTTIKGPDEIPAAALINFDDLPNAAVIADHYRPTFGVRFEKTDITQAIIYGNEPAEAASPPNVAINNAIFPNTSANVPMNIFFDEPKTHVGFYLGNGETIQPIALLTAYDVAGAVLCQARLAGVPEPHTAFIGLSDPDGRIASVSLTYGDTALSESIDNLYFAPRRGIPPTRTPVPTWTPVPTAVPTSGPAPTATPLVPAYSYFPVKPVVFQPILSYDLSIQGIEITQGIQCFDTSKGLATCPDNSMPVANKKDTTARIYLKISGVLTSLTNVPVRLHIFANGVEYIANTSGKAVTTINQANRDAAEVYFNVNFTNDIPVSFYAEVDPNNALSETNETNNRYPAVGTISLNFRKRDTLKIVGYRLYYHPSGYSGSQYAGGWAVNGGAADWFEQLLPMRNNGVNYSLRSGYLNWTKGLGSGDNQHDLIQTLNGMWLLENLFPWLISGQFSYADHVYGWAPNDGYTGGHADMPVYPHAGGLGVVGIGTDRPGTSTDDPGGGALIFGHELVHDYDVFHTDTVDACGSNDSNSDFPYSSSNIQEFGFNPLTGKIYDPSLTHDVMSYCPAGGSKLGWISPFTWNRMFNELTPALAEGAASARPGGIYTTQASESLLVEATLYNPLYQPPQVGKLGILHKVENSVASVVPKGEYSIELRNVDGAILYSQPFAVSFESEYDAHSGGVEDAPPFPPEPTYQSDVSFIIPWIDGATQVVLTSAQGIIDQRTLSANPPQVLITNPTAAESWQAGSTHTLTWQGLDLDNDPLSYTVFYSYDGGSNWGLLAGGLSQASLDIQTDDMAGGSDVRFRVIASDGIQTGLDETDQSITIPNHAPSAVILSPAAGAFVEPGGLVVLQGAGFDFEDGTLPDGSLVWSSDIQGGVGIGPSVPLNSLQPGAHTLTLTVTDSFGIHAESSVAIFVGYPIYLPAISR